MDRTVLVADVRYLVYEVREGKKVGPILEWECLEVSDFAIKVQNKVKLRGGWSLSDNAVDEPFWILKDNISDLKDNGYRVIETLKNNK